MLLYATVSKGEMKAADLLLLYPVGEEYKDIYRAAVLSGGGL